MLMVSYYSYSIYYSYIYIVPQFEVPVGTVGTRSSTTWSSTYHTVDTHILTITYFTARATSNIGNNGISTYMYAVYTVHTCT